MSISFSTGGSDSGVSTATGTVEAQLSLSDDLSEVTGIEFTGGTADFSDVDLNVSSRVNFSGQGRYQTDLRLRLLSLSGTLGSTRVGEVSGDGVLENEPHSSTFNGGQRIATLSVPDIDFSNIDFQYLERDPLISEFIGTYTISQQIIADDEGGRVILFTINGGGLKTESDGFDGTNLTITTEEDATVILAGELIVNNQPPVIQEITPLAQLVGVPMSVALPVDNYLGSGVLRNAPAGLSFDHETRNLEWDDPQEGSYEVTLEVDSVFGQDSAVFTLNVLPDGVRYALDLTDEELTVSPLSGEFPWRVVADSNRLGMTAIQSPELDPPNAPIGGFEGSFTVSFEGERDLAFTVKNVKERDSYQLYYYLDDERRQALPESGQYLVSSVGSGAHILRFEYTSSILDSVFQIDDLKLVPKVEIAPIAVEEGSSSEYTTVQIPIELSFPFDEECQFKFFAGGQDIIGSSSLVTIPPGVTRHFEEVKIHADSVPEPDETISLTIADTVNCVSNVSGSPLLTILNDDIRLPEVYLRHNVELEQHQRLSLSGGSRAEFWGDLSITEWRLYDGESYSVIDQSDWFDVGSWAEGSRDLVIGAVNAYGETRHTMTLNVAPLTVERALNLPEGATVKFSHPDLWEIFSFSGYDFDPNLMRCLSIPGGEISTLEIFGLERGVLEIKRKLRAGEKGLYALVNGNKVDLAWGFSRGSTISLPLTAKTNDVKIVQDYSDHDPQYGYGFGTELSGLYYVPFEKEILIPLEEYEKVDPMMPLKTTAVKRWYLTPSLDDSKTLVYAPFGNDHHGARGRTRLVLDLYGAGQVEFEWITRLRTTDEFCVKLNGEYVEYVNMNGNSGFTYEDLTQWQTSNLNLEEGWNRIEFCFGGSSSALRGLPVEVKNLVVSGNASLFSEQNVCGTAVIDGTVDLDRNGEPDFAEFVFNRGRRYSSAGSGVSILPGSPHKLRFYGVDAPDSVNYHLKHSAGLDFETAETTPINATKHEGDDGYAIFEIDLEPGDLRGAKNFYWIEARPK